LPLPSGASAGLPVTGSGTNQSALRYHSGIVLMIGPGREALFSFTHGLFDTNRIFLVSTSGVALWPLMDRMCQRPRADVSSKAKLAVRGVYCELVSDFPVSTEE